MIEGVAARIREAQESFAEINTSEFARRMVTSRSAVEAWRDDERAMNMQLKTLVRIAEALEVRAGWLLTGDGEPRAW